MDLIESLATKGSDQSLRRRISPTERVEPPSSRTGNPRVFREP
jgi:hypothetical protein